MSSHHSYVIPSFPGHSVFMLHIIPMSFLHSLLIPIFFHHSDVIPPFECHSINHSSCWQYTIIRMSFHSSHVIYLILMPFYHSFVIPSFLTHFDLKTSFRCHPIIWMSFNHLSVILSFESHSSNHSSWWQNTVIWMSFHSFYSHLFIGMTGNDILLGWQEWC